MFKYLSVVISVISIIPILSLSAPSKKFFGGAGVGRFTLDDGVSWQCAYDMILVERVQGKPKTESGLFIPQEDLPKLHLCKGMFINPQRLICRIHSVFHFLTMSLHIDVSVISMGPGREEENGSIAPMPKIKVGDYIIAKDPWGIGPKDEETADGKKLSFMKSSNIAAVLDGSFYEEEIF